MTTVARSVIIVASGRATYSAGGQLDSLIQSVVAKGKNPVLVLGPDGDDLLRSCGELDACEIVFDPNFDGGLFSGIKAGLHAVNGPAFVIPLAEKALACADWDQLESALRASETRAHVIRPVTRNDAAPLYPVLVTAHGVLPLKELPASTSWPSSDSIRAEDVIVSST